MSSYEALAARYDVLTRDVDHRRWADYIERHFAKCAIPVHTVLDLACGTGELTCLLAERGYEMIGVDQSPEMLAVASEKAAAVRRERPIFLQQSMQRLDLYGTVDACICCLDSVNYVTRPADLGRAFQRIHLFLMPGGLFLFDVNTPEKLRSLDGQVFLDETDDTYCIWRAQWSERRKTCTYGMDLFLKEGALWRREEEVHIERAYELEELETLLRAAGFCQIRRCGELKFRAPAEGEQRVFLAARKEREKNG